MRLVKIDDSTHPRRMRSQVYQRKSNLIIYEDNAACIAQIKEGYIKGDKTKHTSPKFFFTYDLQKDKVIDVSQIRSSNNLANLFTKSFSK